MNSPQPYKEGGHVTIIPFFKTKQTEPQKGYMLPKVIELVQRESELESRHPKF